MVIKTLAFEIKTQDIAELLGTPWPESKGWFVGFIGGDAAKDRVNFYSPEQLRAIPGLEIHSQQQRMLKSIVWPSQDLQPL
jgi:hypothetical protein